MDALTLTFSLALPWLLGISVLLALDWPRGQSPGVALALRAGFGSCVGAVLLTLWMRATSIAGLSFSGWSIALPLTLATALLFAYAARTRPALWSDARQGAIAAFRVELPRWQRIVWFALLGWLAIRFALLATEVALRPLYPWDAWVQWATKARVWYEQGHIVPFVREDVWLAGAPGAWFDASPNYPATVPLLQVWTCVALGRWDDSAMNWPWFAILLSLTAAIYGALRSEGVAPLAALVGAYFVASLIELTRPSIFRKVSPRASCTLLLRLASGSAAFLSTMPSIFRNCSPSCMVIFRSWGETFCKSGLPARLEIKSKSPGTDLSGLFGLTEPSAASRTFCTAGSRSPSVLPLRPDAIASIFRNAS